MFYPWYFLLLFFFFGMLYKWDWDLELIFPYSIVSATTWNPREHHLERKHTKMSDRKQLKTLCLFQVSVFYMVPLRLLSWDFFPLHLSFPLQQKKVSANAWHGVWERGSGKEERSRLNVTRSSGWDRPGLLLCSPGGEWWLSLKPLVISAWRGEVWNFQSSDEIHLVYPFNNYGPSADIISCPSGID